MHVNIAVLKETRPHECRVALVPAVVPRPTKLGGKLHTQCGAAATIHLPDTAYADVVLLEDRGQLVADADYPDPLSVKDAQHYDERVTPRTITNVIATRPSVGMFEVKDAVSSVSSDAWERAV